MDKNENPAVTRSDLFDVLDDCTDASSQSIEQLKGLLDLTVFSAAWGATTTPSVDEDEVHEIRMRIGTGSMDIADAWDQDTTEAMMALMGAVQGVVDALEANDVGAQRIAGLIMG